VNGATTLRRYIIHVSHACLPLPSSDIPVWLLRSKWRLSYDDKTNAGAVESYLRKARMIMTMITMTTTVPSPIYISCPFLMVRPGYPGARGTNAART
jgi:hypothetical protein